MSVTPISAAGLGQYVLQASNSAPLKQALQSLQNSLASGDLSGSQSAFQTLQTLYQTPRQPAEPICPAVLNSLPIWRRSAQH